MPRGAALGHGEPEPLLVEFVAAGRVRPTLTLEIGAGTGTNSIWLAERGFENGHRRRPARGRTGHGEAEWSGFALPFAAHDFLAADLLDGPFHFVFDRGCFHVFDEPEERVRFAAQVAAMLTPGGLWLSMIGSTMARPGGGSAAALGREITLAIEPALEIVELRAAEFHVHGAGRGLPSRRRADGAQSANRMKAVFIGISKVVVSEGPFFLGIGPVRTDHAPPSLPTRKSGPAGRFDSRSISFTLNRRRGKRAPLP